jgi:transcriptional regulator with XRE-family HTH domain
MRLEIGWTQKVLAEVLGITRSSLAHYETGRAVVPTLIAYKIDILHRGITHAIETSRKL